MRSFFQIDHLYGAVILLNGKVDTGVFEGLNCSILLTKLIDNAQNYKTAINERVIQQAEAKKIISATKLRPQLIKIIRQFYLFISVSSNVEHETLRMRQLKDMERIAHKGVKRKYVRKKESISQLISYSITHSLNHHHFPLHNTP